jgi:hypothetical protein
MDAPTTAVSDGASAAVRAGVRPIITAARGCSSGRANREMPLETVGGGADREERVAEGVKLRLDGGDQQRAKKADRDRVRDVARRRRRPQSGSAIAAEQRPQLI